MKIVRYPDPILNQVAQPIERIDEEIHNLAEEMIETMHEAQGVGLAGPQVGISKQIIVINPTAERGEEKIYLNPKILRKKGKEEAPEGCLSLPEVTGTVRRATWLEFTATLLSGEEVTLTMEDFAARVLQHEMDHLLGVLFITKIQPAERVAIRGKLRELEREYKKL